MIISASAVTLHNVGRFSWEIEKTSLATNDPQHGWTRITIYVPQLKEKPADFNDDWFDHFETLQDANDHVCEAILAYATKYRNVK